MSNVTHLRFEIVRTFRNRTVLAVTLALPLVLFYAVASGQRHATFDGVSFPLYFMTAMAVYGAMFAAVSPGARVARDRSGGWIRQLRITPLRARTDVAAKVLTAYLVALPQPSAALPGRCVARGAAGRDAMAGNDRAAPGGAGPVRRAGDRGGLSDADRRADPGHRRGGRPVCPRRGGIRVPARGLGPRVRGHEGGPVVLAGAGRQDHARRRHLAGPGLDRDRRPGRRS